METNNLVKTYASKAVQSALMRSVYTWMTLALVITGFVSMYVAKSYTLLSVIMQNSMAFWGLIIAELGLVWYLSARINKMSFTTATVLFIVYSILNGVTLAFIFLIYTMSSIATTFFVTAGTFGVMALFGVRNPQFLPLVLTQSMVGKNFYFHDGIQSINKFSCLFQIFVIVSNSGHQYMTDPHGNTLLGKVSCAV